MSIKSANDPEDIFRPCLRSGMCCKHAPCAFGEWDAAKHQCKFLEVETKIGDIEIHRCGKYAEINALPPQYAANINPAFGAGCCSTIGNTARNNIAAAVMDGRIPLTVLGLKLKEKRTDGETPTTTSKP